MSATMAGTAAIATLTTGRLALRPLEAADAPRIAAYCGELAVARWLARVPHPYPPGAAAAFVALCRRDAAPVWAIVAGASGLVGVVGLDGGHEGTGLGYWIGRPHWGRGYASEAARAVADHHFGSGATALLAGAFEGNVASLRVLRRLGFRETGRGLAHCEALGRALPQHEMRLTRADWAAGAGGEARR